ncbi:c-type cytochrome [Aromatoleum sp.]|uniref:c-type cytochrome n=1 Tax=Aromatoleum sp. TaxID=2307007 RepID=UPI002FC93E50
MSRRRSFAAGILVAAFSTGVAAADRAPEQIVAERCRNCHGPEGRSSNPDFPKLAGQNADYLTRQLANFKTGVRTSEPMQQEVARLTGGEMRALALYFSAKEIDPEPVADRAQAQIGKRLYFSGDPENSVAACITCHGPGGRGAIYLPRLAGQHAKYLVAQLHAFRNQSRVAPDMVMHTVIQNVTDAEIAAIAQFLSGMK